MQVMLKAQNTDLGKPIIHAEITLENQERVILKAHLKKYIESSVQFIRPETFNEDFKKLGFDTLTDLERQL